MGWFDDNHWAGEAYNFGMGYMCGGGGGKGGRKKKRGGRRGRPGRLGKGKGKEATLCEEAKTGRAACQWCQEKIAKDYPRVSTELKTAWGTSVGWYHAECFPFDSVEPSSLPGYASLADASQEKVALAIAQRLAPRPDTDSVGAKRPGPAQSHIPKKQKLSASDSFEIRQIAQEALSDIAMVSGSRRPGFCAVCRREVGANNMPSHLAGKKHRKQAATMAATYAGSVATTTATPAGLVAPAAKVSVFAVDPLRSKSAQKPTKPSDSPRNSTGANPLLSPPIEPPTNSSSSQAILDGFGREVRVRALCGSSSVRPSPISGSTGSTDGKTEKTGKQKATKASTTQLTLANFFSMPRKKKNE